MIGEPEAGRAPPQLQYVSTSDGYSIAWKEGGSGLPLVVIPPSFHHLGLRWTSHLFESFDDQLKHAFRLVQFDGRGQGMSTRGLPPTTTLDDLVRDLEAVVERATSGPVALLGLLRGGKLAIRFAGRHPEKVRALVLWNCDPGVPRTGAWGSGTTLAPTNWDFIVESTSRSSYPQDDYATQHNMNLNAITQGDFIVRTAVLNEDLPDSELEGLRVPTLVLATREGVWNYAAEEGSKRLAALITDASFAIFDDIGGGLYSTEEEAPAGIRMLRDFVAARVSEVESASASLLSPREVEVLRLIAAGHTNAEIADLLVISPNTVRRHVSNIFDKTGATNRAAAAIYARDKDLA